MISYIGGKYRMAKWISSFIPTTIERYVEVFGGAFWVHLKSSFYAKEVIYNDFNRHMANMFKCAMNYSEWNEQLKLVDPQNKELFEQYMKDILETVNTEYSFELGDMTIANKYAYIVTQVFSGIMKDNAKMVDLKGKYKSKYLTLQNKLTSAKFQKRFDMITDVYNKSFEELIPLLDNEDTVFYVDPPYYGTESLYAFHDFGLEHHKQLIDILKQVKGKWLLSYYEFPDLVTWFPKDEYHWEYKEFKKASMASKGKKQSVGTEVLIMNFDPSGDF